MGKRLDNNVQQVGVEASEVKYVSLSTRDSGRTPTMKCSASAMLTAYRLTTKRTVTVSADSERFTGWRRKGKTPGM